MSQLITYLSTLIYLTKHLLFRAPPSFGRHVKPLASAAFAVVSTHQPALDPRGGLCPVLLMCNPIQSIKRLMMMIHCIRTNTPLTLYPRRAAEASQIFL
jgi:hypothetical protein